MAVINDTGFLIIETSSGKRIVKKQKHSFRKSVFHILMNSEIEVSTLNFDDEDGKCIVNCTNGCVYSFYDFKD